MGRRARSTRYMARGTRPGRRASKSSSSARPISARTRGKTWRVSETGGLTERPKLAAAATIGVSCVGPCLRRPATRRAARSTSPTRSSATGRSTSSSCRASSRTSDLQWADPRIARFLEQARLVLAADPVRQARHGAFRSGRRAGAARGAHGRRARGDGRRRLGARRAVRTLRGRPDERALRRDLSRAHRGRWSSAAPLPPERSIPTTNPAGQRWIDEFKRSTRSARTGARAARSRCSRRAPTASAIGSGAASSSARPPVRPWRAR